jgi:hypothetical protein
MGSDPIRIDFPGLPKTHETSGRLTRGGAEGRDRKGQRSNSHNPKGKKSKRRKAEGAKPTPGNTRGKEWEGVRRRLGKFMGWMVGLAVLLLLPFFTLIRTSVVLFHGYGLSGWLALAGGALATVALLTLYLVMVSFRMGGKGRVPRVLRRGAALLVTAYCVYALIYLSGANAKTDEIRATYSDLHPIMRVAVSTLLLVDREGVLTDTGRTEGDYERWGMDVNQSSLHYPQEDGFVHAVDVRTVGRPEWQNQAVAIYFRFLGFHTLRHVGTADHLHVALPTRPSSGSRP